MDFDRRPRTDPSVALKMSAPPTAIAPFNAGSPSPSGKHRNDNSNPQQGTGGVRPIDSPAQFSEVATTVAPTPYIRPTIKIPPTKKDERKLFVGGLPANGKISGIREMLEEECFVDVRLIHVDTFRSFFFPQ